MHDRLHAVADAIAERRHERLGDELLLRAEVVADRGEAHAGRGGDVTRGHLGDPALDDHPARTGQQVFTVAHVPIVRERFRHPC